MSTGLHSLATIIKRLEAATSRIEDLAQSSGWPTTKDVTSSDLASPSSYAAPPAPLAPPPPPPPPMVEDPQIVIAFDQTVVDGKLKPFLELTKSFASASVIESATLVEKQFADLRAVLVMVGQCVQPDQKTVESTMAHFEPTMKAIINLKEDNRKDREWYNHLAVLAGGAPSLGWVIDPTPGPFINAVKEGVDYYGNRIRQEYKDKDPKHAEWVKSYNALLEELRRYVMEYHRTGLSWNPKGIPVSEYSSKGPTVPSPPPPPPPLASPLPAAPGAGGAAAVFAELNRGAEVTKNLRKVDKSEMTHKNPALRAGGTVPSSTGTTAPKKPIKPTKPQALMGKKPAKFALEGKTWAIENQEDERSLILDEAQLNQAVNIFGCKNSTIQIKGKVNAVTLVNCVKTSVLVDSVVSSVSVTKSPSFALQITGTAPMIQIDSTDSGQIFLSKASLGAEITTAKCSAINVSLPVEGEEEGVFKEQAVPEMLRSFVKDGKLITTVVEHVG